MDDWIQVLCRAFEDVLVVQQENGIWHCNEKLVFLENIENLKVMAQGSDSAAKSLRR
ncbi:3452_t:CDS:2, partial [Gigaspora rosea]